MRIASILVGLAGLAGLAACGDPADIEGSYTIAITKRDNGCNFANWTVGQSDTNIGITIAQEDDNASATLEGVAGVFVTLWLGSNVYSGDVDGDDFDLVLFGSRPQTSGNCVFTYNSTIRGTANGDVVSGTVDYTAAGNGNPDCVAIEGCRTYQDFNGTRPPS